MQLALEEQPSIKTLMTDDIFSRYIVTDIGTGRDTRRVGHSQRALGASGYCDCLSARPRAVARWIHEEAWMKKQRRTKLVHEGRYLAEVDIELLVTDDEWSPYL